MNMMTFLDMIIVACGVYLTYGAVILKVKGEITANIMLPKNAKPEHVKDKEGFIAYVFTKLLVLGIITILVGGVILFNDMMQGSMIINAVATLLFAVALVVYGVTIKKAQMKFF